MSKHHYRHNGRKRYRIDVFKLVSRLAILGIFLSVIIYGAAMLFFAEPPACSGEVHIYNSPSPLIFPSVKPSPSDDSPTNQPSAMDYPLAKGFLVLVNWENPCPAGRPESLVRMGNVFEDEVQVNNPDGSIDQTAAQAAKQMFIDAAEAMPDASNYLITSAYRSQGYQTQLWQERISQDPGYGHDPYNNPVKVMPGNKSEHSTGLALDILCTDYLKADYGYADTPEGEWLALNAHKYGFILRYPEDKTHITGVMYEPWHFRYVGVPAATDMFERDLCLEEYLGKIPLASPAK